MNKKNRHKIYALEESLRYKINSSKLTNIESGYRTITCFLAGKQKRLKSKPLEESKFNIAFLESIRQMVYRLKKDSILNTTDIETFEAYASALNGDPVMTFFLFCLHLEQENQKPHLFKKNSVLLDKEFSKL